MNAPIKLNDSSHTKEKDEMKEIKNVLKFTEAEHDIGTLSQHFSTAMTLLGECKTGPFKQLLSFAANVHQMLLR